MVFRSALCLWALSLILAWKHAFHVEASTRTMRKRQRNKLQKVFESKLNGNGGIIAKPQGFLCLRVELLVSSSRQSQTNRDERLFSCAHISERVEQYSTFNVEGYDSEFLANISSGRALFINKARLENGKLVNISAKTKKDFKKFKWGKMKFSALNGGFFNAAARSSTRTALAFFLTSDGVTVNGTPEQMSTALFGNEESMRSQFKDCSGDNIIFNPASGHPSIKNGIVKVTVNPGSTDFEVISNAALKAAQEMGIQTRIYDHLMFALPNTVTRGGWGGLAEMGSVDEGPARLSWYKEERNELGYIYSRAFTVHELAHNLGLEHSGEGAQESGDGSCVMGEAYDNSCFNGAQTNLLGWHKANERSVNPKQSYFSGKIIGINDFAASSSNGILVLEIIDGNDNTKNNLFVNYNRVEGFNKDAWEYQNQIIVTQKKFGTEPYWLPSTNLLYHISEGESKTVENFAGSQNLVISFTGVSNEGTIDYASITVGLEGSPVAPPTSPVSPPTSPVSPPTSPVSPPTSPVAPPASPVAPPTSPVAPPTSPVAPPTSPVTPPTSPVAPPTSPVTPPTSPVSPPTSPVSPPTPSIGTKSLQIRAGDRNKIQGFVFAIYAINDLSIIKFSIRMNTVNTIIKVYTKEGREKSTDVSIWGSYHHQYVGLGKGLNEDLNLGDFECPVPVEEDNFQSFYILGSKKTMYSAKTRETPFKPYKEDAYMEFANMIALKKAETTRRPEKKSSKYIWNGIITYKAGVSSIC